jgi:glycerol kinase
MADSPAALTELARGADGNGGVRVLPGLAGVGAPWWKPDARAVLAGMHGGTTRANVARAALEGIAWRVADVVAAMRESAEVDSLRVDGGLTNEPLLLQLQADTIGVRVDAAGADATVLGAATLGAVGAGVIPSLAEAAELLPVDRSVEPQADDDWRAREHEHWKAFVRGAVELDRA